MRVIFALLVLSGVTAAAASVSAIDSDGRRITLPAPAARIVSLAPHATELLFAAGAGDKVVAVSEYSDYPDAALRLPRVASSGNIDLERVLALRPDLAIAWRLEATAKALDRLQSLGIPVFYSEPHRLEEIPQAIETLATLTGTEAQARVEAVRLRTEIARIRAAYQGAAPISIFYQISSTPLMTLSGRHFVSDALGLCGASNIFADAPIIAPVVSVEAVLAANPAAIIAGRPDPVDTSWHGYWTRFPQMRAVRDGNLFTMPSSDMHRHGPRAIPAAARLCTLVDEARRRAGLKAASRP
jgi:iron complex transport system substrate-binding protein